MAKAQAQVYKALEKAEELFNQKEPLELKLNFPLSKIVKISNLADPE